MSKKKLYIRVPSDIVRNKDFFLSNGEFLLYSRLCYLYFKNYQNEEIKVDHKKLMNNIGIVDARTLKKRLNKLYISKLIKNKIDKLPRKGETVIIFDKDKWEQCDHFTMINSVLFNYLNNYIDENGFRLLFYYKSHINLSSENSNDYCFVGYETLANNLKIGNSTIESANKSLVECKLLKIKKHKLETTYEYDDNDELIYNKYNNHYFVSNSLF